MMISGRFADQKQAVNCAVPFVPELSRDSGAKAGIWMDWEAFSGREPKRKAVVSALLTTAYKVGATGFEPATSWSRTKRSSQAELRPGNT